MKPIIFILLTACAPLLSMRAEAQTPGDHQPEFITPGDLFDLLKAEAEKRGFEGTNVGLGIAMFDMASDQFVYLDRTLDSLLYKESYHSPDYKIRDSVTIGLDAFLVYVCDSQGPSQPWAIYQIIEHRGTWGFKVIKFSRLLNTDGLITERAWTNR